MNIYSSSSDVSTNDVIDWVYFLSPYPKIKRFNDFYIPQKFSIHISKENPNQEKAWYRRGFIFSPDVPMNNDPDLDKIYKAYLSENKFIYEAFLDSAFNQINTINAAKDNNTNKIINLRRALEIGIDVPESFVSNDLTEISNFLCDNRQYIIKDVSLDPIHIQRGDIHFAIGVQPTMLSGLTIKKKLQNCQSSSLGFLFIQEYINKKIELRVFYFRGKIYCMAIFSQNNEKTQIDYRNSDKENPNRCIPFKLPEYIEAKLILFMNEIKVNCGSIDMIYTPDKRYVFLEVNPIGQFQWLARNCNYDIEREIAKFLLS